MLEDFQQPINEIFFYEKIGITIQKCLNLSNLWSLFLVLIDSNIDFFFFGDDKPNIFYTKGKGTGLKRSRNKSEGTEPLSDQMDAQRIILNFLEINH